jgi:hypothetical protein
MPQDSVVFGHIKQEAEQLIFKAAQKVFGNKEYN